MTKASKGLSIYWKSHVNTGQQLRGGHRGYQNQVDVRFIDYLPPPYRLPRPFQTDSLQSLGRGECTTTGMSGGRQSRSPDPCPISAPQDVEVRKGRHMNGFEMILRTTPPWPEDSTLSTSVREPAVATVGISSSTVTMKEAKETMAQPGSQSKN